jgi:hypothetical protein
MNMPCIDFVTLTAAYNRAPSLALMPSIATAGQFAAGNTSVGLGPCPCRLQASLELLKVIGRLCLFRNRMHSGRLLFPELFVARAFRDPVSIYRQQGIENLLNRPACLAETPIRLALRFLAFSHHERNAAQ